MKYLLRTGLVALVIAGCAEEPLAYDYMDRYSLSILQGGETGVYFLPPLLQSTWEGAFTPEREPIVHVCAGTPASPCAEPVARFDMHLDAGETEDGVVRVSLEEERYSVNWHTRGVPHGLYRIFVTEGGAAQAYIDVMIVRTASRSGGTASARRMRTFQDDEPREYNGTIPIAFRMEEVAVVEPPPSGGLLAQYYDWSATAPVFGEAALLAERVDPLIDFADPVGDGDVFGLGATSSIMARWSGTVMSEAGGFHTFCVTATAGMRLYINDYLFFDQWTRSGLRTECRSFSLGAGVRHPIRVEWLHGSGPATARLEWDNPGMPRQVIPTTALSPS